MQSPPPRSPLFSVVIPAYNRREMLRQALDSVFGQTFRDFEVIVVDDGSTEDLATLVKEYGKETIYLRQENAGPGAARNRGASAAAGEYVAFLDSDDLWFPWTLATISRSIRELHHPAIVSGRVVSFTAEADLAAVREEPFKAESFADYLSAGQQGFSVGAGTSVVRRAEFLRVGGFVKEHINAEDHDLVLRMGTTPGFVKLLEPRMVAYRQHAASMTADFQRTAIGTLHLVEQECRGAYPGGQERSAERRKIICRHVRPVVVGCLERGMRVEARRLYRATFRWQLVSGRWKFLLGVPVRAFLQRVSRLWSHHFADAGR
jgi:Glycosyl transferase family 2